MNNTASRGGKRTVQRGARALALCGLAAGSLGRGAAWAQGSGGRGAITPESLPGAIAKMNDGAGGMIASSGTRVVERMATYALDPQDVIRITVERFPDYSTGNIVIPPDGRISLPYFGTLKVNGMTAPQLERALTNRIKGRIRNPLVSVSIQATRSAVQGYINVIGAVQAQGAVEILPRYRLTEVLAKVGGVRGRYDEVEATLTRRNAPPMKVDLYKAVSFPLSPFNTPVKADDVLTVRAIDAGAIVVGGDVARPNVYEMHKVPQAGLPELPLAPRVSDVVVATGGFNNADKLLNGRVTGFVQRGAQKIELRVDEALADPSSGANITFRDRDYVTFNVELPIPVNVVGLVRAPGVLRLRPGSGVLDALAATGGLSRDSTQSVATLQRNGVSQEIKLSKLLAGDTSENKTLQAGDTINLTSTNTLVVSISGAIADPSKGDGLPLLPGSTILTAIVQAGGIRPGLGLDKVNITVVRTLDSGEQRFLSVDPVRLYESNDPAQNLKLQSGDIINVIEKRARFASISGQVARPGAFPVTDDGVDLATFIAAAGVLQDTALLSSISIQNTIDGSVKTVDAYDAVTSGRPLNVKVREGDLVLIPRNFSRVQVSGAVRAPQVVPLPERRMVTVLDAITAAGGPIPGARTQEVVLVRAQRDAQGNVRRDANGAPIPETRKLALNDTKDLSRGNLADARIPLQDGDIILVPEGKAPKNTLGQAVGLFSIFNIARSLF